MKNLSYSFILIAGLLSASACNSHEKEKSEKITIDANILAIDTDPVCKMPIAGHLADTLSFNGKIYGFCNTACKKEFEKNSQEYLK